MLRTIRSFDTISYSQKTHMIPLSAKGMENIRTTFYLARHNPSSITTIANNAILLSELFRYCLDMYFIILSNCYISRTMFCAKRMYPLSIDGGAEVTTFSRTSNTIWISDYVSDTHGTFPYFDGPIRFSMCNSVGSHLFFNSNQSCFVRIRITVPMDGHLAGYARSDWVIYLYYVHMTFLRRCHTNSTYIRIRFITKILFNIGRTP